MHRRGDFNIWGLVFGLVVILYCAIGMAVLVQFIRALIGG